MQFVFECVLECYKNNSERRREKCIAKYVVFKADQSDDCTYSTIFLDFILSTESKAQGKIRKNKCISWHLNNLKLSYSYQNNLGIFTDIASIIICKEFINKTYSTQYVV